MKQPADFGNYRFLRTLGSGGLGQVNLAEDTMLGRRVVFKTLRTDLGPSEDLERRFASEVATLAKLDNPHVPRFYTSGRLPDGHLYSVTEYIEGANLDQILVQHGGVLPLNATLAVAKGIAEALAHAHKNQIVHLDVKPANILIPAAHGAYHFSEAKLIDFGVMGRLEERSNATRAGFVLGTPYYMSPEQLMGKALTPAADVFGLGTVMYEALSGRRPFSAEGEAIERMFSKLLYGEAEPLPGEIPEIVRSLIARCLDKEPGNRPAPGAVLLEELRRVEALLTVEEWEASVRGQSGEQARAGYSKPSEITRTLDTPLPAPKVQAPYSPDRYSTALPAPVAATRATPAFGSTSATAPARSSPMFSAMAVWVAIGVVLVVAMGGLLAVMLTRKSAGPPQAEYAVNWWPVVIGIALVVLGVPLGLFVRRHLAKRAQGVAAEVDLVLKGGSLKDRRDALSKTLAIQVNELMQKCSLIDEKMMGATIAVMVQEYRAGKNFDDRQKALMNAIAILEKLRPKLSPWYVRYEKLIAATVSIVTILSGLAATAQGFAKMVSGKP